MIRLRDCLVLSRPKHWIKNGFFLAPLVFSKNMFHPAPLQLGLVGLASFCLLSASVYSINDVFDARVDQRHPKKKDRPVAAGRVSGRQAITLSIVFAAAGLALADAVNWKLALVGLAYLTIFVLYSRWLKHVVLLDVIVIAVGFVLRVYAGGLIIDVTISSWLLLCTILLAVFLGLCKRRHELKTLGRLAGEHRHILKEYRPYLVDQLMLASATLTLVAYALYTVAPETVHRFKTANLIFTFPLVLYGIFRYLYLIHRQSQGDPVAIIYGDKPLLLTIGLWAIAIVALIYFRA